MNGDQAKINNPETKSCSQGGDMDKAELNFRKSDQVSMSKLCYSVSEDAAALGDSQLEIHTLPSLKLYGAHRMGVYHMS